MTSAHLWPGDHFLAVRLPRQVHQTWKLMPQLHHPLGQLTNLEPLWRSVQVYDLHAGHARGRVRVRPPELAFIHTRRLLGYTHHEVAHIFDIQPPPNDLFAIQVDPKLSW